jgi:putative transcriptional regulator
VSVSLHTDNQLVNITFFGDNMKVKELKQESKKMSVIKQLREELSLTQEQMARELDLSVWSIGKWEAGKHSPTFNFKQIKALYLLMAKAGMSIMDLPDNNWDKLRIKNK